MKLFVVVTVLAIASGFHLPRDRNLFTVRNSYNKVNNRCKLSMDFDSPAYKELQENLSNGNYEEAYQLLKRNPLLSLQKEDARILLNNIDECGPIVGSERVNLQQTSDPSVFLYRRMERQHLLRGFGCIDGEYPEKLTDISPAQLEQITGLSITSLTPKERTTYWRLAGIALVIAEYIFGTNVGIDPIYTLIPGTLLIFGLDQIAFSGKYFETIYRKLFPEYTKKIIYHEAGHFLLSYLLGVPVRGYITSSWDAKKYPEIKGQAGTIFFDNKLAEEINSQKVTRTSIDRLSVVVMAGIAAEALKFGRAEGGVLDEQSLIGFLTSIQPPWNIMRIQGQARWAAVQAILLIREHQEAYDALVTAMEANKPVGDIVLEIEKNLPEVLPSQKRIQERDSTKKRRERDNLLRYIQKMTWNVNGIQPEETQTLTTESDEEQSVSPREMLDQFTERMKMLETAVKSGALDIKTVDESNSKGGIWLNNLDSIKNPSKSESDVKIPSSSMKSNFGNEKLEFPEPLPNYEQRLSELAEEEGKTEHNTVNNNVFARSETVLKNDNSDDSNKASSSANKTLGIREMLMNNRGFQMKQLELVELADKKTAKDIADRLVQLQQRLVSTKK